ncbi:amino acid ABC transporter substrate-binding protein [Mycolicibacterium sp. 624]|uniref:amino acid ABC transporter substrate-binding protein n=1 Tax=Mycolicibacterium sp. 624 TaxID=3156314 RepID=UPI0033950CF9
MLITACGGAGGSGADAPIRIGGTLGLTGALAGPSNVLNQVYEAWAAEVNGNGGLLGRDVEVLIKNDNSTAATATTLYQSLLTKDQVDLVLAPFATYVAAAVVPLVKSSGKLMFNGSFSDTGLNDLADGQVVSAFPYQPEEYSRGAFEAIAELPGPQRPTKVAILTNNDPFTLVDRNGFEGKGGVRDYAKRAGMTIVLDEEYSPGTADFTSAVSAAKNAGADLFVVLGLPEDSNNIIRSVKTVGYEPKIVCACGSQVLTLPSWSELGNATDGVVGHTAAWPNQPFEGMDFVVKFADDQGWKVIPSYAAVGFANLQVLRQAVEGTQSLDQTTLKEYIYSHTFDTVVGPVKFRENGTVDPFRQVVLQTVSGDVRPVWPADVAEAKLTIAGSE